MKETKVKRQVKPKSGRGKPREGLFTNHRNTPENQADFAEIAKSTAPTYDPASRLARLLKSTEQALKNLPSYDQKYQILEDGSWQELSDDETQYQQGVDWMTSPLVEPVSPEYFALQARLWATVALQRLNSGDYQGAIIPIMDAHEAHWKMIFAEQWEYQITGKLASEKASKNADRGNHWAKELAKELAQPRHRGGKKPSFKDAIRRLIPREQTRLYAGFEVYYDEDAETLSAFGQNPGKTARPIKLSTFRQKYYSKA
jgi:hypothetical protein